MALLGLSGPALSSSSAFFLSSIITASFFGGIYLSKAGRVSFVKSSSAYGERQPAQRSRDDPDVIRARLKGISISTLINCGLIYTLVALDSRDKVRSVLPYLDLAANFASHRSWLQ